MNIHVFEGVGVGAEVKDVSFTEIFGGGFHKSVVESRGVVKLRRDSETFASDVLGLFSGLDETAFVCGIDPSGRSTGVYFLGGADKHVLKAFVLKRHTGESLDSFMWCFQNFVRGVLSRGGFRRLYYEDPFVGFNSAVGPLFGMLGIIRAECYSVRLEDRLLIVGNGAWKAIIHFLAPEIWTSVSGDGKAAARALMLKFVDIRDRFPSDLSDSWAICFLGCLCSPMSGGDDTVEGDEYDATEVAPDVAGEAPPAGFGSLVSW